MATAALRPLVWLASALVAVAVLLAPRVASASPAFCDARAVSTPTDVVAMCVAFVNAGVELPDEVAGLCDPSGASAIAPPPALPVESGTIGAADDCDGATVRGAAFSAPGKSQTSREAGSQSDAATLGAPAVLSAAPGPVVHPLATRDVPLPRGFGLELERPPRG